VLGGLTAANGGFNPGTELMDALFDAVNSEQVALLDISTSFMLYAVMRLVCH